MNPSDAIKSLVDFNFYRTVPRKPFSETSLYIGMLSVVFGISMVLAMMIQVVPQIRSSLDWAKNSFPTMTLGDGILTSDAKGPSLIRHPDVKHVTIIIDTDRTKAVTVEEMRENNAVAVLVRNAVYLAKLRPVLESRSSDESVPGFTIDGVETHMLERFGNEDSITLDPAFYDNISRKLPWILYPVAFIFATGFFFLWKHASALIYALMGLLMNGFQNGRLEFPELYKIAVYAQTPVIVLQIAILFFPDPVQFFRLITLLVVGVYLWKAISIANADLPEPPAPSPLPE